MPKRWRIHPHDGDRIARLQESAGVTPVVAQLLICRGIRDPKAAREFLEPKLSDLRDPGLLPGCCAAAEFLHQAISDGRQITIYGDYDVDGMTGTTILLKCLRLLGADANYYVPSRIEEGYGMNHDAVRSLAERDTQVLVTVDCGIASVAEAETAEQVGIDLIVTDHHQPAERLPNARAIVHPDLPGRDYPFAGLSGAGVALKLAWALCQQASGAKRVNPRMRNFLVSAVGLAAMGTVADVVPLVDENRVLVHHGLVSLKEKPGLGLEALMRVTELDSKPALDSEDIGFVLGPRLNAAGRLGQAQLAIELLSTDRADRAEELAHYIHGLNDSRQKLERSIYRAANKQVKEQFNPEENAALVLADRDWHPGVIGIVAGRLAEKYHRPTILIAQDQLGIKPGTGSCRSVPGFDLHAALGQCSEYLCGHGGHAAAAGLTIDDQRIDEFRAAFCEVAEQEITEELRVAELNIDAEAPLSAFTLKVVNQIEQLGPFGQSNARPLLCTSGVSLAEPPRPIGSGGHHLAVKLTQHNVTLRAVAFGGGEWADDLAAATAPLDVAFRPVINSFRGRRNVELHLVDWRTNPQAASGKSDSSLSSSPSGIFPEANQCLKQDNATREVPSMKCWNCLKEIPENAKACSFCEAAVEDEPTREEIGAVEEILDQMPPEVLGELQALMANSTSAEEFVNQIFVGDCPKCNSSETGDCEHDPEIENLLVGRCYDCGHMWCTECEKPLDPKSPDCPCWEEDIEGFDDIEF